MAGRGVVFVVAASSMAVSCFICAAVSLRSSFIYSIITIVALVAMALALAAFSGIFLRLVFSLLLPPTDLNSGLSCSKAFAYVVMDLYSFVEGPGAAGGGVFSRGRIDLMCSPKAAADSNPVRCAARSDAMVTTPYSLTKCFKVLAQFMLPVSSHFSITESLRISASYIHATSCMTLSSSVI